MNRHKEKARLKRGYNELAIDDAADLLSLEGAKVLIVGANTGEDCARFLKRGASEVHGLDVIPGIGANFSHPRVTYHRQSIEATDLAPDQFDLVFAVATMEHVPDIASAFAEMARLTKPGGVVYSSASPLWESPYGHHMTCFDGHPWVHLVHDKPELIAYAVSHGITEDRGHPIDDVAAYMLDPANFNMRPAQDYLAACSAIPGLSILENHLDSEDASLLWHPLGRKALETGFSPDSLLATRHLFVAKKN